MSGAHPRPVDGPYPWVATAPEPLLTITGHTALITGVRFVWHGTRCAWCRQPVPLWTDGGTIDAGLQVGHPRRRSPATTAHWYQTYRPAAAPAIPDNCPHPGCPRPATRTVAGHQVRAGWLDGTWRLAAGPFSIGPHTDQRCPSPAHPNTWRLLDQVWSTLRRTHPELAAAADAYAADRRRRAKHG